MSQGVVVQIVENENELTFEENAIRTRLCEKLGFEPIVRSNSTRDEIGPNVSLIVVCCNDVRAQVREARIPVLACNAEALFDLGVTSARRDSDFGTLNYSTVLVCQTAGAESITAGLNGLVRVTAANQLHGWAKPSNQAVVVASVGGDTAKSAVFVYNQGASMQSRDAPHRRAAFLLRSTLEAPLTPDAWRLFDQAATWCLGGAPVPILSGDHGIWYTREGAPTRLLSAEEYRNWVEEQISGRIYRRLLGILGAIGVGTLVTLLLLAWAGLNGIAERMQEKLHDKSRIEVKTHIGQELPGQVASLILDKDKVRRIVDDHVKADADHITELLLNKTQEKLAESTAAALIDRGLLAKPLFDKVQVIIKDNDDRATELHRAILTLSLIFANESQHTDWKDTVNKILTRETKSEVLREAALKFHSGTNDKVLLEEVVKRIALSGIPSSMKPAYAVFFSRYSDDCETILGGYVEERKVHSDAIPAIVEGIAKMKSHGDSKSLQRFARWVGDKDRRFLHRPGLQGLLLLGDVTRSDSLGTQRLPTLRTLAALLEEKRLAPRPAVVSKVAGYASSPKKTAPVEKRQSPSTTAVSEDDIASLTFQKDLRKAIVALLRPTEDGPTILEKVAAPNSNPADASLLACWVEAVELHPKGQAVDYLGKYFNNLCETRGKRLASAGVADLAAYVLRSGDAKEHVKLFLEKLPTFVHADEDARDDKSSPQLYLVAPLQEALKFDAQNNFGLTIAMLRKVDEKRGEGIINDTQTSLMAMAKRVQSAKELQPFMAAARKWKMDVMTPAGKEGQESVFEAAFRSGYQALKMESSRKPDPKEILETLADVIEYYDLPDAYLDRADLLFQRKEYRSAARDYQDWLSRARLAKSWVYLRVGDNLAKISEQQDARVKDHDELIQTAYELADKHFDEDNIFLRADIFEKVAIAMILNGKDSSAIKVIDRAASHPSAIVSSRGLTLRAIHEMRSDSDGRAERALEVARSASGKWDRAAWTWLVRYLAAKQIGSREAEETKIAFDKWFDSLPPHRLTLLNRLLGKQLADHVFERVERGELLGAPSSTTRAVEYDLDITTGKSYIVQLESSDFDAVLLLKDSKGAVVRSDDDSGGDRNARLRLKDVKEGKYRLVVTSFGAGQGAYTLMVCESPFAVGQQAQPPKK